MADFVSDDADSIISGTSFNPMRSSIPSTPGPLPTEHVSRSSPTCSSLEPSPIEETFDEDPGQAQESAEQTPIRRPLRDAVVTAESPIREHARIDLGYNSNIAPGDNLDDPDELAADDQLYAPFQTQVEAELSGTDWGEVPECEDVGSLNAKATGTDGSLSQLGETLSTDGYYPLIKANMSAEYESGSTFGKYLFEEAQDFWEAMSLNTLHSMPERAVKELMCGNLKQAYDTDPDLRAMLQKFQERGKEHPCIYARTLTMADGSLMTSAESRRLVRWLQRYISASPGVKEHPICKEICARIDSQFRGQWKRVNPGAERAFLASTTQTRLQSRVDNVALFCRQLIARCDISETEEAPLKPLTYIGYASRADHRRRQHEACGSSSNWLATLVQAICNVLWGRGHFQMHFMVVCLLCEDQGMVAEMLLTRIAGAYYNTGGGFCIDVAEKSLEFIHFNKLTHKEDIENWNDLDQWVWDNTPLEANRATDSDRKEEWLLRQAAAENAETDALADKIRLRLVEHRVRYLLLTKTFANDPDGPWFNCTEEKRSLLARYVRDTERLFDYVARRTAKYKEDEEKIWSL